jgi:hypothetical protein
MTSGDCRKRAEEARQEARRVKQDNKNSWLQIAEKYDRLADELDRRDDARAAKTSKKWGLP